MAPKHERHAMATSPDPQYSQDVAPSFAAAPQFGQLSVAGIYYPTKVGGCPQR
jgi:hypothetical protein